MENSFWKGSSRRFLCKNSFSQAIFPIEMEYLFSSIHSVLNPSPPAQMLPMPSHSALFSSFCLIGAVSRRSSLRILWVYILMRSGTVVSPEEHDWQPYLWLAQEGILLLIYCVLLLRLFLFSPPRVLCLSVLDFLSTLPTQRSGVVFADRDVTKHVLWGKKGGFDETSGCIVALCPDWH